MLIGEKRNDPIGNNEFEKDMADLTDWQENQYNSGYYVGTGRIPRPIKAVGKYPLILILAGMGALLPMAIFLFFSGINFENVYAMIFPCIFAAIFIFGGIMQMRKK